MKLSVYLCDRIYDKIRDGETACNSESRFNNSRLSFLNNKESRVYSCAEFVDLLIIRRK